jgi:hemolysin III
MGWLMVLFVKPLVEALPLEGLLWLLAGGLSYTAGVVFFRWESLPYNHAIWHLFVLGGSLCHYVAVLFYA